MILAPVLPVAAGSADTVVTIRLIGMLDRVLSESFSDACAGLVTSGSRTLIVLVRDLTVMPDESLDRFFGVLTAYEAAGHRVFVNGTPAWRKITGSRGAQFAAGDPNTKFTTRRQIIICHSLDRRAGAA